MEDFLSGLNEAQIKPVEDTQGAVLVIAGAGSGKTRVLTSRIANLVINKGAYPSSILAITFTNKAAAEMRARLSSMIDEANSMWICTIHSMCVKILRSFGMKVGIEPNFSIYSETERANLIKKCFISCDFNVENETLLKSIKFHISNAKMLGLNPEDYYRKNIHEKNIEEVLRVYKLYEKHMICSNALDFDDLLLDTLKLLQTDEETREVLSNKFKYIHVDEFQDTNNVQYAIIKLLASKHKNLFVVGDDDQSIYGWRGAEVENILNFEKDFEGAKVYKLERNYRSTKKILDLANEVVKHNTHRRKKALWTSGDEGSAPVYYQASDEQEEALFTAKTIRNMVTNGANYSDFAVLMRLNALTRSYEQEFAKYGIPFKVFGGFKFYERKVIKDLVAYLRFINNPFDSEAILRIINVPRRGIGTKTIETIENYAMKNENTFYDALLDVDELPLNNGSKEKLREFYSLIKEFVLKSEEYDLAHLVKYVISKTKFMEEFEKSDSDENIENRAYINEFVNSVEEFEKLNYGAKIGDYLQQITLASSSDEEEEGNYVTIATIHAVKGLEFENVFICGLEDGILPVSRASFSNLELEEERRLMYVSITRAKKNLYLTRACSRFMYGQRKRTIQSRFVTEVASFLGINNRSVSKSKEERQANYFSRYVSTIYDSNMNGSKGGISNSIVSTGDGRSIGSFANSFNRTTTPVTSNAGQKNLNEYKVGVKVKHAKFGEGTIISIVGGGANMILTISFDSCGVKQLSAMIAPLEIVE